MKAMGGTKPWAIALVVLCTIFTSMGSLLMKMGIVKFQFSIDGALAAYPVIIGLFFYFIGFLMLTASFKHGELSTLFPFVSLSFVWVAILSYFFLHESVNILKIIGIAVIVSGVAMIGISSKGSR